MALTPEFIKEKIDYYAELPPRLREQLYERMLKIDGLTEEMLEDILELTYEGYLESTVDPGEAIGVIAAQSIGEPGTQMSLPGTQKVVIKRKEKVEILPIGEIIDDLVEKLESKGIKDYQNEHLGSIVVDVPPELELYVPALGKDEKIHWSRVIQVSRHLPNGPLLRMTTRSGRSIIATLSHSFVVRENNEIVPKEGRNLKVGDRIPVVYKLDSPTRVFNTLELDMYFPPSEIWHGSEMKKALNSKKVNGRHWKQRFDKDYQVPVSVDGLRAAFKSTSHLQRKENFVYPKSFKPPGSIEDFPDKLELNFLTGWMMGAYLAEGSIGGEHSVCITNSSEEYQTRAIEFAKRYGLGYRVVRSQGEFGESCSVYLTSVILVKLLERTCGRNANTKRIPGWVLGAPDDFVTGLLRAYFDGDGSFSMDRMEIRASSNSEQLIEGISLLLTRFGIFSNKYKEGKQCCLRIPGKYSERFLKYVGSDIPEKRKKIQVMAERIRKKRVNGEKTHDLIDMIPNFGDVMLRISKRLEIPPKSVLAASIRKLTKKQLVGRQTLERLIATFKKMATEKQVDIKEDLYLLEKILDSDVIWDEIISLEVIPSPTRYVYDFTVEQHETFMTSEGIITHNTLRTFHFAGVKERNVTLGLPRLIEILSASKNQSSPVMDVYLEPPYNHDQNLALQVQRAIEQTTIEGVAEDVSVDLAQSIIILRLKRELMEDKGITIDMVQQALKKRLKLDPDAIGVDEDSLEVRVSVPPSERPDEIHEWSEKIKSVLVKGIKDIRRVIVSREQTNHPKAMEDGTEWVLYTEGSNLAAVLSIPGVDPTRIKTNNIPEIQTTLGIEAARQAVIDEAIGVLKEQGLDVDIRHILLVADIMTQTGELRQIGRHGISGHKQSVLSRASFEVTVKYLLEAAAQGQVDPLVGVTENVIIGQPIPLGTGIVELLMNPGLRQEFEDVDEAWIAEMEKELSE